MAVVGIKRAEACSGHADDGMANDLNQGCAHRGCTTIPPFGVISSIRNFCAGHAEEGMAHLTGSESRLVSTAATAEGKASEGMAVWQLVEVPSTVLVLPPRERASTSSTVFRRRHPPFGARRAASEPARPPSQHLRHRPQPKKQSCR